MRSVHAIAVLAALMAVSAAAASAEPLTLSRAIAMAIAANPRIAAATAAEAAARERRAAAGAAWLPRVDFEEGWQRGDQPVYAFSSLLSQRRFTQADFAIDSLNHPDAIDNHHASVTVQQPLFDLGATVAATRSARALASIASGERRQASLDIAVAVAQAYTDALRSDAATRAAQAAIESATEDRERARARRDAGTATDADVLALDVHLAEMRAREIDARNSAAVARAHLDYLLGQPLDASWDLVDPPVPTTGAGQGRALDDAALKARPDVALGTMRVSLSEAARLAATAAWLPRVSFDGGLEWNGASWATRASAWVFGVRADFTLSTGGAERANVRAAARDVERARALQADTEASARLEIQTARARLDAAHARAAVAAAAIAEARESERIIRDRYGAGLAGVTDVLRAAQAVLDADALATSARMDVVVAGVTLDRALGRLPGSSTHEDSAP